MMVAKKQYSKEFKEEAVRLAEKSGNTTQVAKELGLHLSVLRRWKKELEEDGPKAFPGQGYTRDPELISLEKENNRLKHTVSTKLGETQMMLALS